ncbi:uncharacterized protein KZ484_012469 [Pholidichthys leucotaenia]
MKDISHHTEEDCRAGLRSSADMNSCHCGSSFSTYQGLRIHQGKKGCTPKGMRIPQNTLYVPKLTNVDILRPDFSDNMSLQICHCGWSKVTTYHGLRTHQGMKGCTPKGTSIPQNTLNKPLVDIVDIPVKSDFSDNMSLQICHCGWSKVTTYHGLRTHQGMKGCTPKGTSIPQNTLNKPLVDIVDTPVKSEVDGLLSNAHCNVTPDGPRWDLAEAAIKRNPCHANHAQVRKRMAEITALQEKTRGPERNPSRKPKPPAKGKLCCRSANHCATVQPMIAHDNMSLQICHCGWSKVTTYHGLRTHQGMKGCTPKGTSIPQNTLNKPLVDIVDTPVKSVFETPQHFSQPFINSDKARRALDFSTVAKQAHQEKMRAELQQKIHRRECKLTEVKSSAKTCNGSLDAEWLEINNVFSEVMKVVEEAWQKALQPLEQRKKELKREAQELVQKLQIEIDMLKNAIEDLDKKADMQDSSLVKSINWKRLNIDTSLSFGTLQTKTSAMIKDIQHQLEKLSSIELKRISEFAVDVKLDPNTAHHCLILSDDGKKVRDGGPNPKQSNLPMRFDLFGSVLGLNRFTSGRSYWEVDVCNKTGWDLGVVRDNANRKGELSLTPDNGYWVTVHYEDKKYAALTAPPISLPLQVKPQKVGVFVDYEEGLVSFYDVLSKTHIYSFTECSFGGEILPYFSPHLKQDEKNANPLVISTV